MTKFIRRSWNIAAKLGSMTVSTKNPNKCFYRHVESQQYYYSIMCSAPSGRGLLQSTVLTETLCPRLSAFSHYRWADNLAGHHKRRKGKVGTGYPCYMVHVSDVSHKIECLGSIYTWVLTLHNCINFPPVCTMCCYSGWESTLNGISVKSIHIYARKKPN